MKAFKQTPKEMETFSKFISEDIDNIKRVLTSIEQEDIDAEFMVHAKSETVEESAENTDMKEKDIVKTLVFMADEPVAVLCPGHTRVSEEKLEKKLDSDVRMAQPEEVKNETGYIIGGVSPFDLDINVFMEKTLMKRTEVKPAAGSRVVGVSLSPKELKEVAEAELADVSKTI